MEHATPGGVLEGFLAQWGPLLFLGSLWLVYLWAVGRQYRAGRRWSKRRTAAWLIGVGLLMVAMWPSVAHWAHHDIRGHMVQHLLIGMLAPLGLVLAAPLTLALRTLPTRASRQLTRALRLPWFRVLGHPVAAFVLNIGGMYVLYLTPLYVYMLTHPYVHPLVHLHFLAAGYLFTWAIAGPDPAPHRPGFSLRLGVLFVSIATHAYLSKLMYAHLWPRHTPHPLTQIQEAAQWMYYGGDVAEGLLAVALFAGWYQARGRRYAH